MERALINLFKTGAILVAACLAVVMAVYLMAVIASSGTVAPSPAAMRLTALYQNCPKVAEADNAYVYAMGFAADSQDPEKAGALRILAAQEVVRRRLEGRSNTGDLQTVDPSFGNRHDLDQRPATMREFSESCRTTGPECAAAFDRVDDVHATWSAAESWLLPRYLALVSRTGWLETAPDHDVSGALPEYSWMLDGQLMLLLEVRKRSNEADFSGARELLASDVRFWRHVLESSHSLLTKMIATRALNRHFEWTTLILRRVEPSSATRIIPAEWHDPISDPERSLRRSLIGEWLYQSHLAQSLDSMFDYESIWREEPRRRGRMIVALLGRPLFNAQDSSNRYAAYYDELADTLSGPLPDVADAIAEAAKMSEKAADASWPPRSFRNIAGQWIMSRGMPDMSDYAARTADIEGVRRASMAIVSLRNAGIAVENVAENLRSSSMLNPYSASPFEWSATDGAIRFRGLQEGERGEHLLFY